MQFYENPSRKEEIVEGTVEETKEGTVEAQNHAQTFSPQQVIRIFS